MGLRSSEVVDLRRGRCVGVAPDVGVENTVDGMTNDRSIATPRPPYIAMLLQQHGAVHAIHSNERMHHWNSFTERRATSTSSEPLTPLAEGTVTFCRAGIASAAAAASSKPTKATILLRCSRHEGDGNDG